MPIEYISTPNAPWTSWHHSGKCDRCGKPMEPTFPEGGNQTQFYGALSVAFSGGYGGFYDGPPARYILCEKCARELTEKEPWIKLKEFGE